MTRPIHLIQWGSPDELDEIEEIKELLAVYGYKVKNLTSSDRITSPGKMEFLNALKRVVDSNTLQILYLSCHGNKDGISYSSDSPASIGFLEFFSMMKSSIRDPEKCITVILGFCSAMDDRVCIENYAPEFVFELIGFKASPTNLEVSALGAGIIADVFDFGKSLSAEIKIGWPKSVKPEDLPLVVKGLAEKAHLKQEKKPGRFLRTNPEDVVRAVNYGNGKWIREKLGD